MTAPALPDWIERAFPPGMTRRMVDVGGVRMHVAIWDGPGPTVVLMHGNPTWGYLWRHVVARLRGDGLRLVVPDLIGLGLSDKPRDPAAHQLSAHAAWTGRLLAQVAPGRVILAAQDWGGPIGLGAFLARPDDLCGLVLANTVIGPPRPGFRPTTFHRFARAPVVSKLMKTLPFWRQALPRAQGDRATLAGENARPYTWPLTRWRDREAPLALAHMVPDGDAHPSVPTLQQTQVLVEDMIGPIELVWGTRDPVLGSVIRHLERALPNARVTRTEAGHFLQEEVPDELAAAIRRVASNSRGRPGPDAAVL